MPSSKRCKDCGEQVMQSRVRCYDCGVLRVNEARKANGTRSKSAPVFGAFTSARARQDQRRERNAWEIK